MPLPVLLLLAVGCGKDPFPVRDRLILPTSPPDLVIGLAAGLRADPEGTPGAEARWNGDHRGIRFRAAYAQSSSDFLSLGSLLTGRYPASIPLCGAVVSNDCGLIQRPVSVTDTWCSHLPEDVPTLPGVLALYGYRTALAWSGIPAVDRLSADFGDRIEVNATEKGVQGPDLDDPVGAWWTRDDTKPRLLVVVLGDLQLARSPRLLHAMEMVGGELVTNQFFPAPWRGTEKALGIYATEADRLGRLLDGLLDALPPGARERWVIRGSTNGVSIAEQRGFTMLPVPPVSNHFVVDRAVHVPLSVEPPTWADAADLVVTDPVEMVDVLPTLVQLASAVPPAGLPGTSLLDARVGERDETDPARSPDLPTAWSEFGDTLMVRQGRYALLYRAWVNHATSLLPEVGDRLRDAPAQTAQPRLALYDVVSDPYQERDLQAVRPATFDALWKRMIAMRSGPAAPAPIPSEHIENLRLSKTQGYW